MGYDLIERSIRHIDGMNHEDLKGVQHKVGRDFCIRKSSRNPRLDRKLESTHSVRPIERVFSDGVGTFIRE